MTDKTAIEQVMTAFEEFKAANDNALAEIKKNGVADPILTDKIGKLETELNKSEAASQKATAAILEAKKAIDDEKAHVDELEKKLNALSLRGASSANDRKEELKSRVDTWARAVVGASTVGEVNLNADQQKALKEIEAEYKSLSIGNDTTGGYLAPVDYVREIIKTVTEISPARQLVRVRQTASKSIQLPKRIGQFAAQWVAEQGNRAETDGLRYGLMEIPTHELYALIDISAQNLEDSAFNLESELSYEATEQFALAEGAAVVNGNGVGKPEGFMTVAGVAETNSGSAATIADSTGQADGLLTMKHSIKTNYTRNATWVLNRRVLGSVRRLKDGQKNYIWQPGLALGKPNTIDGDPYVEFPDMPDEAAGAYPIAYGDFSRAYTLVDRIQMSLLRDPYTQATSGNLRFIFRRRLGGQVTLTEAFAKLKCSA